MIGLVVPDLVHPFFAELAKGVSKMLRSNGYALVIASSEEDSELEAMEVKQMLTRRLDVLLIASAQSSVESFRRIEARQRPFVLIDRRFSEMKSNFVGSNDRLVAKMATEHLIERGCKRIAYIGGQFTSPAVERLEGCRRAIKAHRLALPAEYIICRSNSDDSADNTGYAAMKELLKLKPRPDGVFCYNDPLAMGAMEAALAAGLRIPHDLAVIGCGNVRYASALRVPLSSIDQGSERIGQAAATLALELLNSKGHAPPKEILIPPKLVVRDSTAVGGKK
jgi:LacI family transcriptional regulator